MPGLRQRLKREGSLGPGLRHCVLWGLVCLRPRGEVSLLFLFSLGHRQGAGTLALDFRGDGDSGILDLKMLFHAYLW